MAFRKKDKYSYYSGYQSYRKKSSKKLIITIIIIFTLLAGIVFLNRNRITLMIKGYSWSQTSEILELSKKDVNQVKEYEYLEHLVEFKEISQNVKYYEYYNSYKKSHSKVENQEIVELIDYAMNEQLADLKKLDYSQDDIWEILQNASNDDLQYIIDQKYDQKTTAPYLKFEQAILTNMGAYIESYQQTNDYEYSINIVNYPFILSTNQVETQYTLADPDDITNLIKPGFNFPSDYEPSDLVVPNIPNAPDNKDNLLRKEAAKALEEMTAAAKKDNMHLVLNSAYRSFQEQTNVYNEYEEKYGGLYASQYVAKPGTSEHQSGLGADLTSQSVLDGERLVFGDTVEYDWVLENAHKYGFVVRFLDETAHITGIAHEPWHIRYLGDLATDVYESGYTYEEYCLYHSLLPKVNK